MNRLPLELVELILSHIKKHSDLYQCTLVNKSFYLTTIPHLWHTPWAFHRQGHNQRATSTLLKNLQWAHHQHRIDSIPLGHHIRQLCFTFRDSSTHILLLVSHTPFVESVFIRARLSDQHMDRMAQLCPRLVKLELVALSKLSDQAMESLARHCPRLEQLTLTFCEGLTTNALLVLKECGLKRLTITGNHWWRSATHLGLFHQLTHLSLSTGISPTSLTMTSSIGDWLPTDDLLQLQELTLTGFGDPDGMLVAFIQNHPCLVALRLIQCRLDGSLVDAIVKYANNLERLDLDYSQGVSADGLQQLIKHCPRLAHVSTTRFCL
ncbi:hypothetical protein BC941DRAFT_440323 [Chlamydoabsidia padenii]|nr:hypothetical protein BC941DRAFT_440323 [Chlamydoabsidia padenii]